MIKRTIFTILGIMLMSGTASAAIVSRAIEYKSEDGSLMEGYVAYDSAIKKPHPAVLIVHDWMGLGDFQKRKADQLAKEGYVAFAADVYGKGIRPANADEAGKLATQYKTDRKLMREHIRAAYDTLVNMKQVDGKKVVVMGYCFGGTVALELARSGAPLAGTASFHGGLSTPTPEDAKNITGKVLAMHGSDDPLVPPSEVEAFKKEMKDAKVDLTFTVYKGAVHAFTNPDADKLGIKGIGYNAAADKKSWKEFEAFLKKVTK